MIKKLIEKLLKFHDELELRNCENSRLNLILNRLYE